MLVRDGGIYILVRRSGAGILVIIIPRAYICHFLCKSKLAFASLADIYTPWRSPAPSSGAGVHATSSRCPYGRASVPQVQMFAQPLTNGADSGSLLIPLRALTERRSECFRIISPAFGGVIRRSLVRIQPPLLIKNQSPSGSGFLLARRTAVDIFSIVEDFHMNRSAPGLAFSANPLSISKAIDGFLKFKTAEGLSQRTISSYEFILSHWLETIGDRNVSDVQSSDLTGYLAWLRTEYKPVRFNGSSAPLSAKSIRNVWVTFRSLKDAGIWSTAKIGATCRFFKSVCASSNVIRSTPFRFIFRCVPIFDG